MEVENNYMVNTNIIQEENENDQHLPEKKDIVQHVYQSLYPREEAYYKMCPVQFVDEIFNFADDYIADGGDELEKTLRKMLNLGTQEKDLLLAASIRKGSDQFVSNCRKIIEKNFDKFEMYVLRNIFPLPHDFKEDAENQKIAFDLKEISRNEIELSNVNEDELDNKIEKISKEFQLLQNKNGILKAQSSILDRNFRQVQKLAKETQFTQDLIQDTVVPFVSLAQKAQNLKDTLEEIKATQEAFMSKNEKKKSNPLDDHDFEFMYQQYLDDSSGIRCNLDSISQFHQELVGE